jgi:hypothetical protein
MLRLHIIWQHYKELFQGRTLHSRIFSLILAVFIFAGISSPKFALEENKKYDFYGKDGQNFKGAIFVREEKDTYIIRMYFTDQEIRIFKKDLKGEPTLSDTKAPFVNLKPEPGSTLNTISVINLNYSEPVVLADRMENYRLEGSGRNKLSLVAVKKVNEKEFILNIGGQPGHGKLTLYIDNIRDTSGNHLKINSFNYELDTISPELQSQPPNGSRLKNLHKIILKFSKPMKGLAKKSNYFLQGNGLGDLKLKETTIIDPRTIQLDLEGKPGDGKVNLQWKNITDKSGNSPTSSSISYECGSKYPAYYYSWSNSSTNPGGKGKFEKHVISLRSSLSMVSGSYSNFFSNIWSGGARWEYTMDYLFSRIPSLNNNPLAPGSVVEIDYQYFPGEKRTMSGFIPGFGLIWYISFFPQKTGRLALSFSYGFTFLSIKGRTFDGNLNVNHVAVELGYQFLISPIIFGIFLRQNIILDSGGSIFSKCIGIKLGYTF